MDSPTKRYVELLTERTVQRFLTRVFLRDARLKGLFVVAPFIAAMSNTRFSLRNLCEKVAREHIPTYVVTREPTDPYQVEAIEILRNCQWVEIRYNDLIHAKVYVATAERDLDSFALFGSGNLTTNAVESNIELGMLVYNEGPGREILRQLHYWVGVRLRTFSESRLVQRIRAKRS